MSKRRGERIDPKLLELWPFEYQEKATDFILEHPQAGLFIDMGMGKTSIVLHALLEIEGSALVVGPINVVESVWEAEARKWAATRNMEFVLFRGDDRTIDIRYRAKVYLTNPELLQEALDYLPEDCRTIIFDESTMYKNPSTKRFKQLKTKLRRFDRRIIMTGTPSPNGLEDLWTQIYILDLGERLDTSFTRFKQRYFYKHDYLGYDWRPFETSMDVVTEKISDIVFRLENNRERETPVENTVFVTLPDKAWKHYVDMEKIAFAEIGEEGISADLAATKLGKLRQISAGFIYDDEGLVHWVHDEKLKAIQNILDNTGSPVIVVYQYQHELEALMKAFPQGRKYEPKLQGEWDRGELPVLFLHPQSGGHGLNLQMGGHVMIINSASFSLEQMMQIRGRIDRTGQKNTVIFHTIVADNTVDELLLDVLRSKSENQTLVLEKVKAYADQKGYELGVPDPKKKGHRRSHNKGRRRGGRR